MRANMTKKLCPLLTLLLAAMSCGKKATNSSTETGQPAIENQESTANIVLELNTKNGRSYSYKIKRSGSFSLPEFLKIKSGSLPGRTVVVTFGVDPKNSGKYALQCNYVTTVPQPEIMDVETCYDQDGVDIGNYTSETLPMYANDLVKMELQGGNSPAEIFAYFSAKY